jgi:ATP-binding cassette subfamily C (CFTR/MRP) protein 2
LDPFEDRSDAELWEALKTVQLEGWVQGQQQGDGGGATGLQSLVSEAGGNMSVGQRQLICLARALLKRPQVLVLDEATASVDYETDNLIQKAIRTEFDCTVLTIAHRLNTIMDVDRIIVLANGRLLENGSPAELMEQEGGVFKEMVETTE